MKGAITASSASGLSATFVGVGVGRFAYIALIPALIQDGWFSKATASYLGAATLLGYLVGAWMANYVAHHFQLGRTLRAAMLLCSLSYLASAFQDMHLYWFYGWRFCAGWGGALLMILAAPAVVQLHPPAVRGRAAGVVFSGIGLGVMAAGTLMPLLARWSISATWLSLGALCLALTAASWRQFGALKPRLNTAQTSELGYTDQRALRVVFVLILLSYSLHALGYLPHTLFWVDYVVRELKWSLAAGGFFWAVFGVGAALGPMLAGTLGDTIGFRNCLLGAFFLMAGAVALPVISSAAPALFISSLLVGAFTPGIVTLVSSYTLQCVGPERHAKSWGAMTFAFALAQAAGGYVLAAMVGDMDSYRPLFLFGTAALLLGAVGIWATRPPAH